MFDFEDLFAKRDPYSDFATVIADPTELDVTSTARGLLGMAQADFEAVAQEIRESRPGMDLRPLVLFTAESEALLANLNDVLDMTAAYVALAMPSMRTDEGFADWLHEQALAAVHAVVEQDAENMRKMAELPMPLSSHFACLHEVMEIPLQNLRLAAAAVNELPSDQRVPFVRIFLQAVPPEQVTEELQAPIYEVLENAKEGIAALHLQQIHKLPGDDQ